MNSNLAEAMPNVCQRFDSDKFHVQVDMVFVGMHAWEIDLE